MAEKGIWSSSQPFLEDEDAIATTPGSENERKYQQVTAGTDRNYRTAKKLGVKIVIGTDIQLNPKSIERQAYYLPRTTKLRQGRGLTDRVQRRAASPLPQVR